MTVVEYALRGAQLLFAIVVFGLSVDLARGQLCGAVPIRTGLSAAAGALGMIVALVGLVALRIHKVSSLVVSSVDVFLACVLLAAGIAVAIGAGGVHCQGGSLELLLGGVTEKVAKNGYKGCKETPILRDEAKSLDYVTKRCTSFKADAGFLFLCAIVTVAIVVWARMTNRTTRLGH